jgi:hypothetical protein
LKWSTKLANHSGGNRHCAGLDLNQCNLSILQANCLFITAWNGRGPPDAGYCKQVSVQFQIGVISYKTEEKKIRDENKKDVINNTESRGSQRDNGGGVIEVAREIFEWKDRRRDLAMMICTVAEWGRERGDLVREIFQWKRGGGASQRDI